MNTSDNTYSSRIYRLWSVISFGAGTRMLAELTEQFSTAEEMYAAFKSNDTSKFSAQAVKASQTTLSAAEKILDYCDTKGIKITTIDENDYPQKLKSIYAPPPVLFYRGDISGLDDRLSIGIVGTRKPCEYSLRITSGIVKVLSKNGFDIISGFADGIDICAQLSAIKNGGKTFSVLGAGIDYNYPKNNAKFRDFVIENGAMITEYLPAAQPLPRNFPQRNRILSGLSMGIAVIEAGALSGSLNSASHAVNQGKSVFAVPPYDLFDTSFSGNVALIREGAIVLMGARDIFNEYCHNTRHTIVENEAIVNKLEELKILTEKIAEQSAKAQSESKPKRSQITVKAKPTTTLADNTVIVSKTLSDDEINSAAQSQIAHDILTALNGKEPMRADDIAKAISSDTDVGDVLEALTELEIYGMVMAQNSTYHII